VVSTDIAEDRNRLRVGIEEPQVADQVHDHLASLGVPAEAVLGGTNLQRSTELGGLTTCASGFHC
jgi:hypothetical protein